MTKEEQAMANLNKAVANMKNAGAAMIAAGQAASDAASAFGDAVNRAYTEGETGHVNPQTSTPPAPQL